MRTIVNKMASVLALATLLMVTSVPITAAETSAPAPMVAQTCSVTTQTPFEYAQCRLGEAGYDAINATVNQAWALCRTLFGRDCQDLIGN